MLLILSPSKTLDFESPLPKLTPTQPLFAKDVEVLAGELKKLSAAKLGALMELSPKLAALNAARYRHFADAPTRPALFAYRGDVYEGMEVAAYGAKELAYAQKRVRILSGLYGVLRPLDLIRPYRLEMGTRLKNPKGHDLYTYWGERLSEQLEAELKGQPLINLASQEYAKAAPVSRQINIQFKEQKGDSLKIIGLFAKRARGMMADYAIQGHIDRPEDLKTFTREGYRYAPTLSTASDWVFVRKL